MPKALLLDFGSVMSYSVFEQHALSEARLGLKKGSLTWLGPFKPEADELWQKMQQDSITERDYWQTRAKETGALIGQNWGMLEFLRAVRDPLQLIRPEIELLVKDAKDAGLAVGILSNELELFYGAEVLGQIKILEQMDFIIDATHTKILKPDARAYAFALRELACDAKEVVFVDDQQRNVLGAEAVGMLAVHFDITGVNESIKKIRQALTLA